MTTKAKTKPSATKKGQAPKPPKASKGGRGKAAGA
jgi:hypothetical protein